MKPTIFHKIIAKEVPADIVYEDEEVLIFKDIQPQMKTHLLVIPKAYIPSVKEAVDTNEHIPGMLIQKARQFAAQHSVEGYKLQINVGEKGGQEVMYIHLHLLSNKELDF